jgi:hypothetical protein
LAQITRKYSAIGDHGVTGRDPSFSSDNQPPSPDESTANPLSPGTCGESAVSAKTSSRRPSYRLAGRGATRRCRRDGDKSNETVADGRPLTRHIAAVPAEQHDHESSAAARSDAMY